MPAKYWATWASVSTPNLITYPDGICKRYLFTLPKHLYGPIQGFTADPDDELPAPDAGQSYFIHGVLRYWDVFSETDRFTRFCYREDRGGSILGKGWHIAGGERCNQET